MLNNPAKERMRAGGLALGMIVRMASSPDIARIAKTSGHDFLFLDMQHALFDVEALGAVAQIARACGVSPFARARGLADPDIPRLLDHGVNGVIFPDINTPEEARRAVEICRFAPGGKRSVAGGYPVFDFRPVPLAETIASLNGEMLVVCMVETAEGLANADAIAAVPGVDVVHIGCSDLSIALGKPGAFSDPEIVSAVHRVIDVCKAHGKWSGFGGDKDLARQAKYIRAGIQFVTTQTDIAMLMAEATRRVTELREASS
ncbi:aldolase/citrate lyase family protein [soil metagenome]